MKLLCGPDTFTFAKMPIETLRVMLYGQPMTAAQGSAGASAAEQIRKAGLEAPPHAWDLLSLALSVVTADCAGLRTQSPDGWAREFELDVAVTDQAFWASQSLVVENALAFLTTDRWRVRFHSGGWLPKRPRKAIRPEEDCVVLLSGGLDSLVGVIDLVAARRKPLAVSQVVRGDAEKQESFARSIGGGLRHLQLNHNAEAPGPEDTSQRTRSLIFLAFGVLAGTTLRRYHAGDVIPLFVCENGFIAINPPLTGSRIGSLSTRTAHPEFLARFQEIINAAGLRVLVTNPYAQKTKGEMVRECANQKALLAHAVQSTSCGRFQRYNYKHCGRCVPCQVRRAAFLKWGVTDTTRYVYDSLGKDDDEHARFDDVRSVAMAIAQVRAEGLNAWLGTALSYPHIGNVAAFQSLSGRGLAELESLHQRYGVK